MAQINEKDITSDDFRLAFQSLSAHVRTTFPSILPLEVFTVGGAMIVIMLGARKSTHDVDVCGNLLEAQYGEQYPNIKTTFLELCGKTFAELKDQGLDLGSEKWANCAVDNYLPKGPTHLCFSCLSIIRQFDEAKGD